MHVIIQHYLSTQHFLCIFSQIKHVCPINCTNCILRGQEACNLILKQFTGTLPNISGNLSTFVTISLLC